MSSAFSVQLVESLLFSLNIGREKICPRSPCWWSILNYFSEPRNFISILIKCRRLCASFCRFSSTLAFIFCIHCSFHYSCELHNYSIQCLILFLDRKSMKNLLFHFISYNFWERTLRTCWKHRFRKERNIRIRGSSCLVVVQRWKKILCNTTTIWWYK